MSEQGKIAFCFLLYNTVEHDTLWQKFFLSDKNRSFNIYSHLKTVDSKTPEWIKNTKIRTIKTGWCQESLVYAWIKLLKEALKDPSNKYFTILSGSCIPLLSYSQTYSKIFRSKKSRINVDLNAEAYTHTGLYYADQWVILNRKHAELLVKLKETKDGGRFIQKVRKRVCDDDGNCFCPDELYPINWFVDHYGVPSSPTFRKEFKTKQTTFTSWGGVKPHPIKYTLNRVSLEKEKICNSGSIFARKFYNKASDYIGMKCKVKS